MQSKIERKCCNCGELFQPDYRNRKRQLSCPQEACRKAMKAARQRRWLSKPENKNYFRGSEHVERVREWRGQHPGYWKRAIKKPSAPLQDALASQVVDTRSPLQDALSSQHIVLIGLISQICGTTLQDDIAKAFSNLLRVGRDILSIEEISPDGSKGNITTRADTPRPQTV
jgi:hypothetical protein